MGRSHDNERTWTMRRHIWLLVILGGVTAACGPTVNVEQERSALLARDKEWSGTTKDPDKFASYYAPDATAYPQGMPKATGPQAIKEQFVHMASMPGFTLRWTAAKAEVSAGGDLGYTSGTYTMAMNGAA